MTIFAAMREILVVIPHLPAEISLKHFDEIIDFLAERNRIKLIENRFIEHKTVQQTIRETCHSSRTIERYITCFKQILMCHRKGMNIDGIAFSVRKTPRVFEYHGRI